MVNLLIISASVNVAISRVFSLNILVMLLPLILRIVLGPFHPAVVICVYYSLRVVTTLVISLLLVKTVIMTFFIVFFDRVSGTV